MLPWDWYIIPVVAAAVFWIFAIPKVEEVFTDWIPEYSRRKFLQGTTLLVILLLNIKLLDIYNNST